MFKLREYQEEAVRLIWKDLLSTKRALCVLPTGAGKSLIFVQILDHLYKLTKAKGQPYKTVVLLNKVTLLRQTKKLFDDHFKGSLEISIYCGSENEWDLSGDIVVSTIQSIESEKIDGLNFIIIDEVHNFDFDRGRYKRFIDAHPCSTLGLTATPFRNGKLIYGDGMFFSRVTYQLALDYMIDNGFLCEPRMKRPDNQCDTSKMRIVAGDFDKRDVEREVMSRAESQVDDAFTRVKDRKKIVWACSSIDHAESVFQKIKKIEDACIVHSKMTDADRTFNLYKFETTDTRHLVFVTIVSEGYDYPPTDAVVFLRPTRSINLYIQTVGRSLRNSPGKSDALILDYGQVVQNCGPLNKPFLSSGFKRNKEIKEQLRLMSSCPNCKEIFIGRSPDRCTVCDFLIRETKITKHPDFKSSILANKKEVEKLDVTRVTYKKHTSKNGNVCFVIDYHHGFLSSTAEYFQWGNQWAMKNLWTRSIAMFNTQKIINNKSIDDFVNSLEILKIPKAIKWKQDGKFKKIVGLEF